ncbi:hypothetical protein LX16_1339 [Stackebrandtia albiflava]|uniref:VOC domain-containing protein n=1 Tax=Stackebrandtia albiflava TaxID=406432 RepID=A0A562VCQ2_9ACTN|nr:VOC family protein [Stackebrandtia albiflava]TWJ15628.1 hypothetical protein LX16_1339 [Stackebrandtia albiflava]
MPRFYDGEPCWVELYANDTDAAAAFYTDLFGWRTEPVTDRTGHYRAISVDGDEFGGITSRLAGNVPEWLPFFKVADVGATIVAVTAAGGATEFGPDHAPGMPVMALFRDPAGARFGVTRAGEHGGARCWHSDGAPSHFTLLSRDPGQLDFYRAVFDWRSEPLRARSADLLLTAAKSGESFGKLHVLGEAVPYDVPIRWVHDFLVGDVDAVAAAAERLGASLDYGPAQVPGIGRIAFLTDPAGAGFGVATPE